MTTKSHWDRVYATNDAARVSWFQPDPLTSLRLIEAADADRSS
jgi:hypothetical protein